MTLRRCRLANVAITFALAVASGAAGLNALLKSKSAKVDLTAQVPTGTILNINTNDVSTLGAVVTAICLLIGIASFGVFLETFVHKSFSLQPSSSSHFVRIIKAQSAVFSFLGTALFAVMIPLSHFVRTREAHVAASLGGRPLPASVIKSFQKTLGVSTEYRTFGYLRLLAILPWFACLWAFATALVLAIAASRANRQKPFDNVEVPMSTSISNQEELKRGSVESNRVQDEVKV